MTFGSLGCRPRAQSIPHCHGVLVVAASLNLGWQCRTAAKGKVCSYFLGVQKATFGSLGCQPRSAEREVKARFQLASKRLESDVWQPGLPAAGPIHPSLPWCFGGSSVLERRVAAPNGS